MVDIKYANAYSEILEILKYISIEDYNKIPKDKIKLFEVNSNKNYLFDYNPNLTLNEQNVSEITKIIIAILFRDYWATPKQRKVIIAKEKRDRAKEEYKKMLESGNIEGLAYNTYSMGRGIFTVNYKGYIVNYKGVDSKLKDEENIAVGKVDAEIYDVSQKLGKNSEQSYGITVVHFPNQGSEIRVRGASQLQNLINEKQKLEENKQKDKDGLIKFPEITEIKPFSSEFCKMVGLPTTEQITEKYINELKEKDAIEKKKTNGKFGNYALNCLEYMKSKGKPLEEKNQTWEECFKSLPKEDYEKIKGIPDLEKAIKKQDENYELGAAFGQTTRILENPFRIMDLAFFTENNKVEGAKAILNYTSEKSEKEYITNYAETMGKNLAGFMNLNLAYNNWGHRQDFALSAEICDDAYDDVTKVIEIFKDIDKNEKYHEYINREAGQYYNQIYLFASNMKVIEDTYRMVGKHVPEDYQEKFVDNFLDNLKNKEETLEKMKTYSDMDLKQILEITGGEGAIKNFKGYEEYVNNFRIKLNEKILERRETKELKSTQDLGKETINEQNNTKLKSEVEKELEIQEKEIQKQEIIQGY